VLTAYVSCNSMEMEVHDGFVSYNNSYRLAMVFRRVED